MLLSAVSVLVVAQSSSEIPEGLMNNPVLHLVLYILSWHRHGQLYVFTERARMLGIFMSSQFNNKLVSKAGPSSGDTD